MKIVIISPAALPVPPPNYGGIERVLYHLANNLKDLCDVTIICTKNSNLDRNKINVIETVEPNFTAENERLHFERYKDYIQSLDDDSVILDHTWYGYVYLLQRSSENDMHIIHTHHGLMLWRTLPIPYPRIVAVSNLHADHIVNTYAPAIVIHNGLDLQYKEYAQDDYYLCLNRITSEKGILNTIHLAQQKNLKLVIAGDDTHSDKNYVDIVKMRCQNYHYDYYGLVDNDKRDELLKNCKALITTPASNWVEAFGLNALEAQAYGKPVIATANGGLVDIIKHGITGYYSNMQDKLLGYLDQVDNIKQSDCVNNAKNFDATIMAKKYYELAKKVLQGYKW
ncbi:MAG: glycosyltransferase [Candidatus Nitrosocaldaceae archaeon]